MTIGKFLLPQSMLPNNRSVKKVTFTSSHSQEIQPYICPPYIHKATIWEAFWKCTWIIRIFIYGHRNNTNDPEQLRLFKKRAEEFHHVQIMMHQVCDNIYFNYHWGMYFTISDTLVDVANTRMSKTALLLSFYINIIFSTYSINFIQLFLLSHIWIQLGAYNLPLSGAHL